MSKLPCLPVLPVGLSGGVCIAGAGATPTPINNTAATPATVGAPGGGVRAEAPRLGLPRRTKPVTSPI